MAARQAVGIVHGRAMREDETLSRDDLAEAYAAEHLTAPAAAASGWVDEVIAPADSRASLAWALRSLRGR
jgi:acetyl-CoA carboxylase carboxyltransferase component